MNIESYLHIVVRLFSRTRSKYDHCASSAADHHQWERGSLCEAEHGRQFFLVTAMLLNPKGISATKARLQRQDLHFVGDSLLFQVGRFGVDARLQIIWPNLAIAFDVSDTYLVWLKSTIK